MKTSRRSFLKLSGCLTIGFAIDGHAGFFESPLYQELPESLKRNPNINSWLEVLADGRVRIFTGKLELGQGVRTAIAQVAAEELDLDMKNVEVIIADTGRTPNEGYTAGSGSMENSAMAVRFASAAAKAKLIQLAAARMEVNPAEVFINNGKAHAKTRRQSLTFAQLLDGKQITDKVAAPVSLKPKNKYRLVGKAVPREDIRNMVTAKADYIHDMRFPGMVHARVVRPPAYAAKMLKIDEQYVKKELNDVLKIVKNGSFLGVITADEYDAVLAEKKLRWACTWSNTTFDVDSEKNLQKYMQQLPVKTERVEEKGSLNNSAFALTATYYKPYIMHGSIGPSCAVAIWKNDKLHVWSHSQGVFPLREALSEMLKLPAEKIRVTGAPGAGCYGHNGADDVAAEAALLAIAYPGKHVRLQWSREDEHLWEPYGSAMIMKASANLDGTGRIKDWRYELRSDNHSTRPGGKAANLLPAWYIENAFDPPSGGYAGGAYRNSQPYYKLPNVLVDAHIVKGPLRISALRSLGAYANIFAIESFMDELAEKAGNDPFEFRLMHSEDPRSIAVIEKLRDMISAEKTGEGTGIGIAFSRYKNHASYCAVAAKVAADPAARTLRLEKMWGAIDAGETINIDGVINQTEGGMIQSASWTLIEEVKFDDKKITTSDWSTYPIMRFADTPAVHVEVINRPEEEILGAGEAAQGPAAAAIANAVFHATGKRIRELPITIEKVFGK